MISEKGMAEFTEFVRESIELPGDEAITEPEPDNRPAPIGDAPEHNPGSYDVQVRYFQELFESAFEHRIMDSDGWMHIS